MEGIVTGKVVYDHEGVFIHSSCGKMEDQDSLIPGILRVLEKDVEVIVDWRPLEETLDSSNILCAVQDSNSVVEWNQTPKERPITEHQNSYEAEWDMVNTVSFKKKYFSKGGVQNPVNNQSQWSFFFSLTELKSIKQNKEGMGWSYFVFCLKDDVILPALHFHHGGSELLLECLEKYVVLCESKQDSRTLLVDSQNRSLSQSFENLHEEPTDSLLQKFRRDPYAATMINFSKVTNFLVDTIRGTDPATHRRPPQEMADFLVDAIPDLKINQQEESGFEVITRIDVGTRPEVQRRDPVSTSEWESYMDSEGRFHNVHHLKTMIFKGGLCHAVRKEAWKFLLNYFPWNSTKEERSLLQKSKTDEYFRMKLQWKSVSEEQENRNSRLRDYRCLIEKDVNRTDRTNRFYEGDDNPGVVLLHDILMTYCMYDFDLGYVQGMSDLLSPILYVMENEADAFWCFVSYMDQMHENFEEQMQGMKMQLVQLSTLLRLLDSGFCSYLESKDSGYLYFCFRWLLIRFKREFSFHDIHQMWEELPPAVCEVLGLDYNAASLSYDTTEDCTVKKHYQTSPSQNSTVPVHPANGTRSNSNLKALPNSVHTPSSAC
uniref:Rab-GAP TBC domain-containing protein n=1 Tax=Pyxicephalus adspersus TaxID=30357 RepID=A0AAV3AWB3_PYXAD|nr:TPA: hypothetical protein GDO54_007034 [Pyxicephalus adspersus]